MVDASGGPVGDNQLLSNDVGVIRQVLRCTTPTIPSRPQFQAADANLDANNGCGNGVIDAGDVTVIRRYSLGELPLKPACGPSAPVIQLQAMTAVPSWVPNYPSETTTSFTVDFDSNVRQHSWLKRSRSRDISDKCRVKALSIRKTPEFHDLLRRLNSE